MVTIALTLVCDDKGREAAEGGDPWYFAGPH